MPNKNIFCNSPWYELHIYWDGSFGICCQESHKLYADELGSEYNISKMTIAEWFNSKPVRNFRLKFFGDQTLSECSRCMSDEVHGGNSRRLKCNMKSVIFTRTAFKESYNQSPGNKDFTYSQTNQGVTSTHPVDLHVDLGNYCNLACKMCNSRASSTYALQEVKWGNKESQLYIGSDWTRDQKVWENFKKQLLEIPKLNNIHFMGGETLLTDRFEDLVDHMIAHSRFDVCFSFVTNGTTFNPGLLNKLKKFKRVGLEVSIETLTEHNAYIRQGTNHKEVLQNIQKYQEHCNGTSITLTLRPAPSILSIGYLDTLLNYALDKKFVIKYNVCYRPEFMNIKYLPKELKELYLKKYQAIVNRLAEIHASGDYNASDPNRYQEIVKDFAETCISILSSPTPDNKEQLSKLVQYCAKWDKIYGYNANALYPEWKDFLTEYNYGSTVS